jgi:hypothetical protein
MRTTLRRVALGSLWAMAAVVVIVGMVLLGLVTLLGVLTAL